MLNKRQERIIVLLHNTNGWMTGREISGLMDVSDRTVRSDIEKINSEFRQRIVESNLKKGYRISEEGMLSLPPDLSSVMPETPEERCVYIIRELLFEKKEINLMDLQDQVFISGYTIENDLKRIRKMLEPYRDLHIERSRNRIYLNGPEEEKRRLYKNLLTEETRGNFLNMNNLISLYKDFDLLKVKKDLDEVLEKYGFHVRETAMPMLLMHIGVSVERMLHYNFVRKEHIDEHLQKSIEYRISDEFYRRLSARIGISYTEAEAEQIALLLMGKRSEEFMQNILETNGRTFNISAIVSDLLDDILITYDIDFRKDEDLRSSLQMHIRSMIERNMQGVNTENLYLSEVKRKYPLIFDMSVHAGRKLSLICGNDISEDEIGFLALHLGSAYEKSSSSDRYRVLLICPGEGMLGNHCLQRIETRFSNRIEVIGETAMFEEGNVRKMEPDLILTTLPLKHRLEIPTVQISLFMDAEDENNIHFTLTQMDRRRNQDQFEKVILKLIRPEFFYAGVRAAEKNDLIRMMCSNLEREGYVESRFCESVLQRERISSTSFELGFALPHALNMDAVNSCLSIAILENPVQWGNFSVKLVIMPAIRDADRRMLGVFFDWMTAVVSDSGRFSRLLQAKTYDAFIAEIRGGMV